MSDEPILRIEGLTKHYESKGSFVDSLLGRKRLVKAVDDVDLELKQGETLGVVGESGCGKTTLGRAMLRLVEPTAGSVYFCPGAGDSRQDTTEEIDLTSVSRSRLRSLRTDLQYIFQDPFSSLNPRMTVGDIIGEPLDIHGIASGEARTDRIYELLDTVGLNPSHAHRYPHEFSGGQRQRIGIARALAVDPEVIVCDEPVSALDVSIQAQILNLLEDLQDQFDLSYIFIAHDLGVVEHISDRVAVMYLGEIAEVGTATDVFHSPKHPYTEALLSVIPEPDPQWVGDKILLKGEVPSPIDPPSGCRFHPRCHRIIQPPKFDLPQPVWRSLMDFTIRVRTIASVEELLVMGVDEERPDSTQALDRSIRANFDLPDRFDDAQVETVFEDAIAHLHDSDVTAARELLNDTFQSPCETQRPELTDTNATQSVSCLLYTDGASTQTSGRSSGDVPADD